MADVVTFDPFASPPTITEISTGGDNELDWREIYSEWKVWSKLVAGNLGHPPAFRVVGGDEISDVQDLGSTFFMLGPWVLRPAEHDHRLKINGNLFYDPAGKSPIVPTLGAYTVLVETFVSNLVDASVARLDLAALLDSIYIDMPRGSDANDGTNTAPVATVARAFELAAENNLRSFTFRGSLVLDRDAVDWVFAGLGSEATALIDLNGYDVDGASFRRCEILGSMLGRIEAISCKVSLLDGLDGVLRDCGFNASFTVADDAVIVMRSCFSEVAGTGTPEMALGANCTVNVRGWDGGLKIKGATDGCVTSVDLNPGRLVLDSSNIGGIYNVRGLSELADTSGPGCTVVSTGLVRSASVEETKVAVAHMPKEIWYNSRGGGTSGQVPGTNGTQLSPVDTEADVYALLALTGAKTVHVDGIFEVDRDTFGIHFAGVTMSAPDLVNTGLVSRVYPNGFVISSCTISDAWVFGSPGLGGFTAHRCVIFELTANPPFQLAGGFIDCTFLGNFDCSHEVNLTRCSSGGGSTPVTFNFITAGMSMMLVDWSGEVVFTGVDRYANRVRGSVSSSIITFDNTCGPDGEVFLSGIGKVVNESSLVIFDVSQVIDATKLDELWNASVMEIGESKTAVRPTGDGAGFEGSVTIDGKTYSVERQGGGDTVILTRLT